MALLPSPSPKNRACHFRGTRLKHFKRPLWRTRYSNRSCCASTIRLCKQRTLRLARFHSLERQSTERRLAPAAPKGAASSSRRIPVCCVIVIESRTETPRGSQHGYPYRDVVGRKANSTAISIITIGHWLFPLSHTRPPVGLPCGRLSWEQGVSGEGWAYHVPRQSRDRLGLA